MSSSWIRTALKYALLLTPTAILVGLVALVATGSSVAAILRNPSTFDQAPVLIQKLTRAAYWHTRKHWHTVPDCVQFDRDLLYRPRPGSCVFENAEFSTVMHFDRHGARLTPAPAVLAGGPRPRLVILGDSHAMGWGVEDRETFASLLASEFGYETVNYAVSSYATVRELRRLARDFVLRPDDVVVIQYCDNDYGENRRLITTGRVGPFDPSEFNAMINYRPTDVSALPIGGLLLRLFWQDVVGRLAPRDESAIAPRPDPASAFLAVLRSSRQLVGHRVLVVAINDPGNRTHLDSDAFADAGVPLIVPALASEDFLRIDDHMRPRGHRTVAHAIAQALAALP